MWARASAVSAVVHDGENLSRIRRGRANHQSTLVGTVFSMPTTGVARHHSRVIADVSSPPSRPPLVADDGEPIQRGTEQCR